MAFVLNDRVKETTTTTGTGTINLAGAATGFETFVAGIGNSNVTYYCIAGQGTTEFEVGIGTVTDASPDTLSRTTILSSSNSDSAVDFSAGTKDVFCTLPAGRTIREVDTALNVPTGTTAQRAGSPAAGDFRYNTTTGRFEGYLGSTWGSFGASNSFFTNIFAGDGSDTTFTLSQSIDNENDLLVFIDGVFQAQNVYSVSGTTLTFATAPANGRVITVYSVKAGVSGADYSLSTMTGDGSDTTLTLNTDPVNENNVQVYIDGVYQNKDTFSVSGTTLTFSEAPPNNTKVEAIVATQTTINTATQLLDADGDTKVMVEESSDEDTIRMDIAGTEVLTLTNSAMTLKGTTPTLTIGDAGAEDTKIVFDGNAQDFYVALDDSADDLIIGLGSTVGTTPIMSFDENKDVTINEGKLTTSGANGVDNQGLNITDTGYSKTHKIYGDNSLHIQADSGQQILFKPNATEGARFDASGNLGIGTTAPTDYNASDKITIANTSGNASMTIVGGTSGESSVFMADGTSGDASYRGYVQYQHTNDNMNFGTGGSERLRILGNNLFLNGGTDARIQLGSGGAGANTVSNDTVHIRGDGDDMKLMCANDGQFLFEHNGTERLRLSASGGTYAAMHITSDYGRMDAGALNTGYHHIMAQSGPSTFYFNVRCEANGGFHTYSDENLKQDITTITGALDSVAKMKGVTFKWKDVANRGGGDAGKQFGVTAQNMLEVDAELPSLDIDPLYNVIDKDGATDEEGNFKYVVDGIKEDDKYYTMDYSRLTPFFIEAIKELKTKLEAAEARIATLEGS